MSDHPALVTFRQGWGDSHETSPDGFPIYKETVIVSIERPPLSSYERVAIKQDFIDHPNEYEAFRAIEKAKRNIGDEGYPLVYWPAATLAEVQMLAARNIATVEDLAKLAGNRELPGQLADLALRAERMVDLQKNFGKYEAMLAARDSQVEVLQAQVDEMKVSLSAANSIIETLKMKAA